MRTWKRTLAVTASALLCSTMLLAVTPTVHKKAKKTKATTTTATAASATAKAAPADDPKAASADDPKAAPAVVTSAPNPFQGTSHMPLFNDSFQASRMQGSLAGTPGIWNTQFAETLLPGQVSTGVYLQRYIRGPGGLVITDANTGWTVGVTKRLELTFTTNAYRRIRTTAGSQLTFGRNGTFNSFNPVAPFVRVPDRNRNDLAIGPNDWSVGATFGLLSQDRGDPIGLAIQFTEYFPYTPSFSLGVNNFGVSTTEPSFNENVMIDKWFGLGGEMAVNLGYTHNGTADPGGKIFLPLPDTFNYDFGEIFPLQSRLQGIVEFNGNVPIGYANKPQISRFGVPSPLDLTVGIRVNPTSWMGINAGYRYNSHSCHACFIEEDVPGWVFGLSFGPPPPVPAPPPAPVSPTLTCNLDSQTVQPGATVHLTSSVSPQGLPYTYSWTTTGGKLTPSDSTATLDTTGLAPGMYTITGRVDNGSGGTADCSTSVEVREPVRNPPTASCSVDPSSPVAAGAALTFNAQASSPDQRPLTYAWQISAGHPDTTTQATVHVDTTGAAPGPVNGSLTVTDDRGLTATCSAQGTIQQPPPPPAAALASTLQFKPNSSRVDNAAKAALDDAALRLQQDATSKAVIVGTATSTEVSGRRRALSPEATTRLAEERAVNAKAYLVTEKGISADRIEVRQSTDTPGTAAVWIVPQGASYTGPGQTFDESAVKPARVRRPRARPSKKG
ncbi:MAG TPA: PKD domain-containing protein [Terriglobales bacterium]|nr:PKD domain-containing protein [Terriglobales bacterium]